MKLKSWLSRSNGSQLVFLAGLLLGLSTNVAVAALAPRPLPNNWVGLLVAALAWMTSALAFTRVAWWLQRFGDIATQEPNDWRGIEEIRARLVSAAFPKIVAWLASAIAVFIVGILAIIAS